MKRKEVQKIKDKSASELNKEARDLREKVWELRRDLAAGKVKNVREIRAVRKNIARMLTVLAQKRDQKLETGN